VDKDIDRGDHEAPNVLPSVSTGNRHPRMMESNEEFVYEDKGGEDNISGLSSDEGNDERHAKRRRMYHTVIPNERRTQRRTHKFQINKMNAALYCSFFPQRTAAVMALLSDDERALCQRAIDQKRW
jgi:hypothetical protein